MSEELKTLKDLNDDVDVPAQVFAEEIKAEAVKWIKSFDKKFSDRIEFKTGALWFCLNFFNLTEEDLE